MLKGKKIIDVDLKVKGTKRENRKKYNFIHTVELEDIEQMTVMKFPY